MHAVLLFFNYLLEGKYDSGGVPKHTIAVFLDLKKAFDTVDHVIGEFGSRVQGGGLQTLPAGAKKHEIVSSLSHDSCHSYH